MNDAARQDVGRLGRGLELDALRRIDRELGGTGDGRAAGHYLGVRVACLLDLEEHLADVPEAVDRLLAASRCARCDQLRGELRASVVVGALILVVALLAFAAGHLKTGAALLLPVGWCCWLHPARLTRRIAVLRSGSDALG